MKEFMQVLRRFVPPYKKYLVMSVVFNILSAVLNIFSFAALIPILGIIFKTDDTERATELMEWDWTNAEDVLMNNMNYYVNQLIGAVGPTTTLLIIGLFLAFMTALKTGAYFAAAASIIPIRTGVVRDIRNQLYQKITSLPLGFFSEERKGDIIARMSGDVQEVENSIMASLEMLFKNPILIVAYFGMLLFISWELTLFTLIIVPVMGWFMGWVGRKLKAQSIKAQSLWSDTMSQVEETLPHVRVSRHGDDSHRLVVRRCTGAELRFALRPPLYLLHGDALQHHQPPERFLESQLQHTQGTGLYGAYRQNPDG